jgi:hypothetical protein
MSPDDIDSQYRRWTAADPARPADAVSRAVLAHAARVAAERRAPAGTRSLRRPVNSGWRKPLFAGLAAATLAGLLVSPHLFDAGSPVVRPAEPMAVRNAQLPAAPQAPAAPARQRNLPAPAKNAMSSATPLAKSTSPPAAAAADAQEIVVTGGSAGHPLRGFSEQRARAGAMVDRGAALRQSAAAGDAQGVTGLLDDHVDIESRDSAGRTALMLAVLNGRDAVVSTLLARGADPHVTDAHGDTPLHAAVAGNHPQIAAALERAGAR